MKSLKRWIGALLCWIGLCEWDGRPVDVGGGRLRERCRRCGRFTIPMALALLIAACAPASAESYFCVSPGGTRTSGQSTSAIDLFTWEKADCYGSLSTAVARLTPGAQLWLDDGTYSTALRLTASHSGTPEDWTVVRARHDGQAVLAGSAFAMLDLKACAYVQVEGLKILPAGDLPIYVHAASHHFKILRCCWNAKAGLITDNSYLGLMEDCYAWGGPHRYAFQCSKGANRIVYRRCLVRWDYSNIAEPLACFASYTCDRIAYQNCISLDGTDNRGVDHTYDGLKSFFTPNGSTAVSYAGCISLAMRGAAGWWLEGPLAQGTLTDCIGWDHRTDVGDATDTYDPYTFASTADRGGWVIRRCTFGLNDFGARPLIFDSVLAESMRNSIIYGMTLAPGEYAVSAKLDDEDFNCYWDNTGGRHRMEGLGPHSIRVDPWQSGMLIPAYIMPGSLLATAGEGGGRLGAEVMWRTGRDGSLWGEPGWDELQRTLLWPWPGEQRIRADCRAFNLPAGVAYSGSPAMDGARGFCADGRVLTEYVLRGGR